jgi:FMN phosphatase YigB (HAD superfamily)
VPSPNALDLGPRPLALLVDLDDTIVFDPDLIDTNWRAALDAAAAVVPFSVAPVLEAIQIERDWYWSDPERQRKGRTNLVAARGVIVAAALLRAGIPESTAPTAGAAIVAAYGARVEALRALLPGAAEALGNVRDMGIKLALVANGAAEIQRAKLERFGLTPLFDAIVVEGEFGRGKPDPAIYAHALSSLGVAAADAWACEAS